MFTFDSIQHILLICVLSVGAQVCYQGDNCRLPNCYCGGRDVPGNLIPAEIPQIIAFSFDDAVNSENYQMYEELFLNNRFNPNGCPISMTMFVSHNFTKYDLVRDLYSKGMEVAVHSVTHRTPTDFWKTASTEDLRYEIVQQRKNIADRTGIPISNITGWRSPFLQPTGDRLYSLLQEENFQYDATMTVSTQNGFSSKFWPNTLDYGWQLDCNVKPCPKRKFPGLWEVPVMMLEKPYSANGCLYLDSCRPDNKEEAFQIFWVNFHSHYTGTRAPLLYTMHASWLREKHNYEAMNYFLLTILHYYSDVFIVNYQQLIAWMQNPTKLVNINDFNGWKCRKKYLNFIKPYDRWTYSSATCLRLNIFQRIPFLLILLLFVLRCL